jgi:chromosome segregation ATPase
MSKVTKADLARKIEQATNARHAAEARVRDVEARAAGAAQDRDMRIRNLEAELAYMKARPCESEHGRLDEMWQGMVRDLDEARAKARNLEAQCAALRTALESISKRSCRGKWDACGNADDSASEASDALDALEAKP